jgi:hypothetical protein
MTHPTDAVAEIMGMLHREPVFLAGSCVAAEAHGFTSFSDVDLFVPTQQVLMTTSQILLSNGATLDDRFDRVWHRWKRYGLKGWHTNSLKLELISGVEVNVVFKMVDGHPTTSLAQVLESFDFGLLGVGYDIESGQYRDMRPFLFPQYDINGPLPLMPNKRDNWLNGFISQYNGLREAGRYAKYHGYGYDLTAVAMDLVHGYRMAAMYHSGSFKKEGPWLSQIYTKIADLIEGGDVDELTTSYQLLDFNDPLDQILEALE